MTVCESLMKLSKYSGQSSAPCMDRSAEPQSLNVAYEALVPRAFKQSPFLPHHLYRNQQTSNNSHQISSK